MRNSPKSGHHKKKPQTNRKILELGKKTKKKIELKNSIENYNNRLNQAEERISELEDRSSEITQSEEQNENRI